MKIVKSTDKPTERALVSIGETVKEVPKKVAGFLSDARKKNLMIVCAVFLVGAAVILNVAIFSGKKTPTAAEKNPATQTDISGDKDALSEDGESYFAIATLDRRQAREEALTVLQLVVESEDATAEEKQQANESISRIAEEIEMEANVETLIRAKGFADCVAVISNGKANVIVATPETLLPNQLAQIKEILYTRAEILPVDTTIIERIVNT